VLAGEDALAAEETALFCVDVDALAADCAGCVAVLPAL
jgi:hypothetical protein